jgi:hypothetical protein
MFALHFDNIVFLLIVVVAGLLRLLASKAGSKTEKPPEDPTQSPARTMTPIDRDPADSDTERIRKFLEALGQPPTSTPPPPVKPREVPPPLPEIFRPPGDFAEEPARRRNVLSPLPPLTTVPPPMETRRRVTLPREIKRAPEPEAVPVKLQEAPKFEVQAKAAPLAIESLSDRSIAAYGVVAQAPSAGKESRSELAALLASPAGLRQAIILREIFGPPRSMQPLDSIEHS